MTLLALLGALFFTVVVIYLTIAFFGNLYFQHMVAGLNLLEFKDWLWVIGLGVVLVALWIVWIFLVGTHIHIGVS